MERAALARPLYARGHRRRAAAVALHSHCVAQSARGFVITYAIYQLLPLPALGGSRLLAILCGCLGGLVGTLFGTGGPFYVMYLKLRDLDKSVFRATFATNFSSTERFA